MACSSATSLTLALAWLFIFFFFLQPSFFCIKLSGGGGCYFFVVVVYVSIIVWVYIYNAPRSLLLKHTPSQWGSGPSKSTTPSAENTFTSLASTLVTHWPHPPHAHTSKTNTHTPTHVFPVYHPLFSRLNLSVYTSIIPS